MRVNNLGAFMAKRLGRAPKATKNIAGAAILAGGMMFAGSADGAVLLSEDFNGLTLGPFVSASESGGDGTDWTDASPAGWVRDNTTTPVGGPVEFFGFTFMDIDSWIATEGDQGRSAFTRGGPGTHNTVMVADGDAYDDGVQIDPAEMNVFMTLAPVDLTNIVAGSVKIGFDSSFFPYDTMTGLVDVSFDGGTSFTNLLTVNAANSGGDSSLTRIDEAISLDAGNPSGGSMLVRFGLTQAGNDWYWAVDNVSISGDVVPEPGSAVLAGLAALGAAGLAKRRRS